MWLRDLSLDGKLVLRGKDRVRFLNGMLTNDIAKLPAGAGCRAAMLTVKGRLLGDALVFADEDGLLVELAPSLTAKIHEQLERHLIVDEVEIEDATARLDEIGVYGEEARAAIERALGPLPELPPWGHRLIPWRDAPMGVVRVIRAAELGLVGYRLIGGARGLVEAIGGGAWLDEAEVELRRIEAGEPRYGVDMSEDHLPIEARLDDAVSLTKGCYMGQEVIARATARGHINKRLCGLQLDGEASAEPGAKLRTAARPEAGVVTSSVRSPRFGSIALAYVHRSAWEPGTEVEVLESSGPRRAVVRVLPFGA